MTKSKNIFKRIAHERPWSSESKYFVWFHLILFTLIWSFTMVSIRHLDPVEEPLYIDPVDTSITERIARIPHAMHSNGGSTV